MDCRENGHTAPLDDEKGTDDGQSGPDHPGEAFETTDRDPMDDPCQSGNDDRDDPEDWIEQRDPSASRDHQHDGDE